ncbi:MAG TPA: translation initiation factor IF-2 [Aggregatilineales bacterium]|nr:translation initiation factor IF-2 [Aggregatilineales bacterium]
MAKEKQIVEVPAYLTVRELANLISASPIEVMKQLINNGIMATINQTIDFDTAAIVVEELGFEAQPIVEEVAEDAGEDTTPQWKRLYAQEDPKSLVVRPPVVTILGHVDHGKTTLLDTIRDAKVAEGEAGGITQHIGAYQVVHNGRKITFLDTPGHEAFTAMRARGAQGADIAVLVVAADDGVMQTTKEAIAHARAAHVPIVVAVTKIDKRNANPERVKQELSDNELVADDWGGTTLVVPVSAREKTGIEDLLEAILLTADEMQIVGNPNAAASGTVLEARMDKSRGGLATLLVQNGTLRAGDIVVAGASSGRIRAMFDEKGKPLKEASPSTPALVMGLSDLPMAGDIFTTFKSDRDARALVEERKEVNSQQHARAARGLSMEDLFAQFEAGTVKELRLILKADVQGSLEPITNSLNELKTEEFGLKILYAETGNISENDVNLAIASQAIIIGFNVDVDNAAHRLAESNGVDIRRYDTIYQVIEDVEKALKGLLEPVYEDKVIGLAEVKKIFKIPKIGKIAGCIVRDGEARRNARARVRRGTRYLVENVAVTSLKRETEDVREVRAGFECGIGLDTFDDFQSGDQIEFTVRERVN